ncbi:MAG TPA: LacI family DNA-binding transcriptional regulator [Spirochaetia bacterium]|nr:LacI family DNA-binding transcriptional regulator [Spirochaetia bacterium]
MTRRAATIYDVAKKAGVSVSTVSRAVNEPHLVQEETRQKVMKAVEQLKFVPKAEATVLARKHLGSIGVLVPFFTSPSFVQRMRGVAAALSETKFELVVYTVSSRTQLDEYLDVLPLWRRLDGLILMSMPLSEAQVRHLRSHSLEVVTVEFASADFCSVEIDNVQGGRMAARHLAEKGRRRCAFVGESGVPEHIIHLSDLRLEGFRLGLQEAGADLPERYISRGPFSRDGVTRQAESLLELPEAPEAIFAYSDLHAANILRVARARGMRVPEDLSIVGFDGTDLSDYLGLTTVDQSLDASGRVAAETLMSRLTDRGRPPQNTRLQLSVIGRATS